MVTTAGRCYSGVTRYPDGGGLTAAELARWEQVRLAAELIGALPERDTMTTAVIGATGRIGSEIVRGVLACGDAVTALVRDPGKARRAFGEPGGPRGAARPVTTGAAACQRTPGNEVNWRSIARRSGKITRTGYEEASTV